MGIDPVSKGRKVCSFDCVYCQIGKTGFLTDQRRKLISTDEIIQELKSMPLFEPVNYVTFSGAGEPTLAVNLGDLIKAVKAVRKEKIAVITNSSLMDHDDVWKDLSLADYVLAKFDAPDQRIFQKINAPCQSIKFKNIIEGLKRFRAVCKGKFALQMMFIDENKDSAQEMARIAREIRPHEIQINTPLRPCGVKPLSEFEILEIEGYFEGMNTVSVYHSEKKKIIPVSDAETLRRRGKTL